MDSLNLTVQTVPTVTSESVPRGQQDSCLFGSLRFDAPFLYSRYLDRSVEGREHLLSSGDSPVA